jgi:hypothetical protein
MTKLILFVAIGVTLLAVMASPIAGHHSVSVEFDVTKSIQIEGKVTAVDYRNPHVVVYVTGKDSQGSTVEWRVETSQTAVLALLGWTKETVMAGMDVRVGGIPAKKAGYNALVSTVFTIMGTTPRVFKTSTCWFPTKNGTPVNFDGTPLSSADRSGCGLPTVP